MSKQCMAKYIPCHTSKKKINIDGQNVQFNKPNQTTNNNTDLTYDSFLSDAQPLCKKPKRSVGERREQSGHGTRDGVIDGHSLPRPLHLIIYSCELYAYTHHESRLLVIDVQKNDSFLSSILSWTSHLLFPHAHPIDEVSCF